MSASLPPPSQRPIDLWGDTQRRLLNLLLKNPEGLPVARLVRALAITENAVRQHLEALQAEGLVAFTVRRAGRGRPSHLFRLTDAGRDMFPRRYRELAEALIAEVGEVLGDAPMRETLRRMGVRTARGLGTAPASIETTARQMKQLGYEARTATAANGEPEIVARNCVFHDLAKRFPAVCEFDLAFMETATGRTVEHRECMVRGGTCCRFGFGAATGSATPRTR